MAEGKLTPKVVVAVDLFGLPANYPLVKEMAKKYNLLILEDGAQGFGGSINGQKACSFGDIATTSFFPAKPLGCYGDGGAVFTDNDEWAQLINSYRVHGKGTDKYDNSQSGLYKKGVLSQQPFLLINMKSKTYRCQSWLLDQVSLVLQAVCQPLCCMYESSQSCRLLAPLRLLA